MSSTVQTNLIAPHFAGCGRSFLKLKKKTNESGKAELTVWGRTTARYVQLLRKTKALQAENRHVVAQGVDPFAKLT
jgi:hypothetical protein